MPDDALNARSMNCKGRNITLLSVSISGISDFEINEKNFMVCHRWWKAAIDAARMVLYGPIEAEVDPAYGLPGYSARCNISHMLHTNFLLTL